jgi:hypothetical protein
MARTTLDIADELLKKARQKAAEESTTLTFIVEEALALYTSQPRQPARRVMGRWVTVRGKHPAAVDIADRDRLYDAMGDAGA